MVAHVRRRCRPEAGAGLIGVVGGLGAFLAFLLLACHVLVHLYATSVVTAAAFDAARIVSGSDGGPAAQADAIAHAQGLVGRWSDDVELTFTRVDEEQVVLRAQAQSPALLPRTLGRLTEVGVIDREVRVRRETFRP